MGPYGSSNVKTLLLQFWFFFDDTFSQCSHWQSSQKLRIVGVRRQSVCGPTEHVFSETIMWINAKFCAKAAIHMIKPLDWWNVSGSANFKTLLLPKLCDFFSSTLFLDISCGSPHTTSRHFEISNCIKKKKIESFVNMGPYWSESAKTLLLVQLSFFNQTFSECSLWQSAQKLLIEIL